MASRVPGSVVILSVGWGRDSVAHTFCLRRVTTWTLARAASDLLVLAFYRLTSLLSGFGFCSLFGHKTRGPCGALGLCPCGEPAGSSSGSSLGQSPVTPVSPPQGEVLREALPGPKPAVGGAQGRGLSPWQLGSKHLTIREHLTSKGTRHLQIEKTID